MEIDKKRIFNRDFILTKEDIKGKILSRSLLWMALGLAVIILVAYLSSTLNSFKDIMLNISVGSNWIWMWILNLIVMISLFITVRNQNISIWIPIILYSFFAFYEGIFISSVLYFSGNLDLSNLLLLMLIPSAIFGIAGMLAYFNLINFSKLAPFAMMGTIILMILGLVLIFIPNQTVEKWYLFLATIIFTIWIGFDLQMIKKAEENLTNINDSKAINRLSFLFGIKLFIDFVQLLFIIIRIFRN